MAINNENSTTPSSEKDLAQTPPWFIKSLENFLGRPFDIDACCLPSTAKADVYYSLEDGNDCLVENWVEDWKSLSDTVTAPTVYCNPPFSEMLTFLDKVIEQVLLGAEVAMLMPNNPETEYIRKAKEHATTIVEMPFRLKFLRPNGEEFRGKNGKIQSPKFSCLIANFTRGGICDKADHIYYDFRQGFKK